MLRKPQALALLLLSLSATQAIASSDGGSCPWGAPYCYLEGEPWLNPASDTRDNLIRLVTRDKPLALPVLPFPQDITRSRSYYFGTHLDEWYDAPETPQETTTAPDPLTTTLIAQLTALGLEATALDSEADADRENRFVSNNLATVSAFFTALQAEKTLTPDERRALAQARLALHASPTSANTALDALSALNGSAAKAFRDYLMASAWFYQGDYARAGSAFSALKAAPQPWVSEAASYMLMRNALNQSTHNATDEYGFFNNQAIDSAAVQQAREDAKAYLTAWPEGQYADSATGMLRRIAWYQQDWTTLAGDLEQQLTAADTTDALIATIGEAESKLQNGMVSWQSQVFTRADHAPRLAASEILRALREGNKATISQQQLDALKPAYENASLLPLWNYLHHARQFWQLADYDALLATPPAAQSAPQPDVILFSEQVLYGDALMAKKQWAEADRWWLRLLKDRPAGEQQQLLEKRLMQTRTESGNPEAIFAADSPITNLYWRSLTLKSAAPLPLLRRQAEHGMNDEERTIALHTLLTRDLMVGDYQGYLQDKALRQHITGPVDTRVFDDVALTTFDWTGAGTTSGYACPALDNTVAVLAKNGDDSHALNCLGEFIFASNVTISPAPELLDYMIWDASETQSAFSSPDRQALYQRVIASTKAEPEDKSYALYRAVMCYAPSGYNHCGGKEVSKATRQGWFNKLKKNYPGSIWAQKLKYYW